VSAPRTIPRAVLEQQIAASDPARSCWVAANAGAGKTHVLAQRVIRLLLDGCAPGRILCLTFTKAAAANMATRVFDRLASWIALDDAALDKALAEIGVKRIDAARRQHARRLFAAALETPGGLKVQTIHAFCTRLLHQFPFEAKVAARFTVLEERAEAELIDRLRLQVLLEAAAQPDGRLGRALAVAITAAADQTFSDMIRLAIAERHDVTAWIDHAGGLDRATQNLARTLGIDPRDAMEEVNRDITDGPLLPSSAWFGAAAACQAGSSRDQEQAARLSAAAGANGSVRVDAYLSVFFTGELEPRKAILTAALARKHPDLARRLDDEQSRLVPLLARRRAVAARDRTAALITIADEVIGRYRAEKQRRGLLDYDDLIDKTLEMLNTTNPSWVHYKLDLGIDHVLIDEAQDTSPKQWEVIQRLVEEFTAGEGARGASLRSIFAVGDEKQSIFSFQGAAPHRFAEMHRHFARAYGDSGLPFEKVEFKYSFRSAPVVLKAVDTVFEQPHAFRGLSAEEVKTLHEAVRATAPGLVEVWPLIEPEEKAEIEAWDAPFDTSSEVATTVRLARRIAGSVKAWQGREHIADPASGALRALRAGDVLVLVRQRGPLFAAIIRALKDAGIAVAGADRLKLTEHIAVMDLMVLADALLLPGDDLALATVLKSPLFGLTEEALFALAWDRKDSLREALHRGAQQDPGLQAIADTLTRWSDEARSLPPFAFYARVLGADRRRARMLARLGPEAADALDEFLSLALDYESRETPSLQGFVAWLRATPTEVKRDMEIARDEVRVMTVHGAKGLEAPVVILADTVGPPAGHHPPRLLKLAAPGAADAPAPIVWAQARTTDVPPVAAARADKVRALEDEYRRLLYVAMTRAADRLIICGAAGQRRPPEGCWYHLVRNALDQVGVTETTGDEEILRLRSGPQLSAAQEQLTFTLEPPVAPPAWLHARAPAAPGPVVLLRPSGSDHPPRRRAYPEVDTRALLRGRLVHRLMQSLPDVPDDRRDGAGRRYLERAATDFTADEREVLLRQVLAVLNDPRFVPFATAASRTEVPIVGRIPRNGSPPLLVSGQVDRLVVTDAAVLIADYKTDRPVPAAVAAVPDSYLQQLALYRAVLARLYSDRPVRAALVWTETPDFMEIPDALLDAALGFVTAG
jgi:ATP-dependent helicase/nuclease subunit A